MSEQLSEAEAQSRKREILMAYPRRNRADRESGISAGEVVVARNIHGTEPTFAADGS